MSNIQQWKKIYRHWHQIIENCDIENKIDINIFRDHDVSSNTHIVWGVPLTLLQLQILKPNKTSRLLQEYEYKYILLILALLYTKYHCDEFVTIDDVKWQFELVGIKDDNICTVECKVFKLLEFDVEKWALGESNLYEKYTSLESSQYHDFILNEINNIGKKTYN